MKSGEMIGMVKPFCGGGALGMHYIKTSDVSIASGNSKTSRPITKAKR